MNVNPLWDKGRFDKKRITAQSHDKQHSAMHSQWLATANVDRKINKSKKQMYRSESAMLSTGWHKNKDVMIAT